MKGGEGRGLPKSSRMTHAPSFQLIYSLTPTCSHFYLFFCYVHFATVQPWRIYPGTPICGPMITCTHASDANPFPYPLPRRDLEYERSARWWIWGKVAPPPETKEKPGRWIRKSKISHGWEANMSGGGDEWFMWLDPGKKKGFAMLIDVGTMSSNTFRQRDVAAGVEESWGKKREERKTMRDYKRRGSEKGWEGGGGRKRW